MNDSGMGDLLRTLAAVPRRQWGGVAGMMGFVPTVSARAEKQPVSHPVVPPASDGEDPVSSWTPSAVTVAESDLPSLRPSVTDAYRSAAHIPGPSLPTADRSAAPVAEPIEKLLPPRQEATLLTRLCGTSRPTGQLDVPATVDAVARQRFIRTFPRRRRPTLARGVLVLADAGEGLLPYGRDVAQLLDALRRVIGDDLVSDGWFLDDPTNGVGFDGDLVPFEPPPAGTPVLLLTDLGIAGGIARRRWPQADQLAGMAARLRQRQSPLLALVPYPAERWPAWLDRRIAMVTWDRRTTGSTVLAAKRRAGWDG